MWRVETFCHFSYFVAGCLSTSIFQLQPTRLPVHGLLDLDRLLRGRGDHEDDRLHPVRLLAEQEEQGRPPRHHSRRAVDPTKLPST